MKKIIFLASVFILLFSAACFAQTTIKAELDKSAITTDETVTYKLTIVTSEKRLSPPAFPDFKGFSVLSSAQSSRISLLDKTLKTMLVYVFVLLPQNAGTLEIPPSAITVSGNKLSSESFSLKVSLGSGAFRGPQQAPPSQERKPQRLPRDLGNAPQYEI